MKLSTILQVVLVQVHTRILAKMFEIVQHKRHHLIHGPPANA